MQILSYNPNTDEFFVGLSEGEFDDMYAMNILASMSKLQYQKVKERVFVKNDITYCKMICEIYRRKIKGYIWKILLQKN